MSHISSNRRKRAAATTTAMVALALPLACLGLAACGGSSSSSTTSANASATTPAGSAGPGARGQGPARFQALRECLQKDGIALPKRPPGQRPGAGAGRVGGFLGGSAGPRLPKGVTRAQYEAAIKKCGGGAFADGRVGARVKSPAFRLALTKFAACMRENGVNVPTPNTSGNGPIFSTKGIDTTSAQFRAAEAKCSNDLRSTFRRGTGPGGASPPSGAPSGEAPAG
jgi:hypothetical protein